jgi:hypothetical protein
MVAADGLAILVGAIAGKHLPERFIQISAAALFLLFGTYMVLENVFPAAPTILIGAIALAVVAVAGAISRAVPERYRRAVPTGRTGTSRRRTASSVRARDPLSEAGTPRPSDRDDGADGDLRRLAMATRQRPDFQADVGDSQCALAHRIGTSARQRDPPLCRMGQRTAEFAAGALDIGLKVQLRQRRLVQGGHGDQG